MTVSRFVPRSHRRTAMIRLMIAVVTGCATAALTPACAAPEESSFDPRSAQPVQEAAQRFGIPESWIRAVIHAESGGNPSAVSVAGAMGVMQLMPATWKELASRYGLGGDPFDVRANILAGTAYLRAMLDRYGDLGTALAAYNAGPARVDAWHAGVTVLPAETFAYVARIAPSIAVNGSAAGLPIAPIKPDWRTAALFSVHVVNRANASPTGHSADDRGAMAAPANDIPRAVEASAGGLFVGLSGHGS